VEEQQLL